MSRRQQRGEQEFGSDSFLDIIANIVGILIILIVIVGMKVARQPAEFQAMKALPGIVQVDDPPVVEDTPSQVASAAAEQADQLAAEAAQQLLVEQQREAEQRRQVEQQAFEERHQRLTQLRQESAVLETRLAELSTLRSDQTAAIQRIAGDRELNGLRLAALRQKADQTQKQQQDVNKEQLQLTQSVTAMQQQLQEVEQQISSLTSAQTTALARQQQTTAQVQRVEFETQQLQEMLQELQTATEAGDQLEHRLSPISELVEKGELHFRVDQGRISHVPLEELLDRLKAQVQSRRSTVTRFNRYEGSVGPVSGYRMSYTVERDSMTPMESVQYGGGTYRVSVSRWTVQPDDSLESETIQEAIRPGSRFRQLAELGLPGSAITFWIYPDSFGSFPPLREIAHGLQLRVAARPLPEGTPIVGSPGGSRSTAQ